MPISAVLLLRSYIRVKFPEFLLPPRMVFGDNCAHGCNQSIVFLQSGSVSCLISF